MTEQTSFDALRKLEEDANIQKLRMRVWEWLWDVQSDYGGTMRECSIALHITSETCSPRFIELERMGAIIKTGETRANPETGRQANIYVAVPKHLWKTTVVKKDAKKDKEYAGRMHYIACNYDQEAAHIKADELLVEILATHGYVETVEEYGRMLKWYA